MAYEILALDLDGTLLNSKSMISPATKEAIHAIMKRGKKVVLATGRPTTGTRHIVEELRLKEFESYVISYNGARITNLKTGEHIYKKTLPSNFIKDAYDLAEKFGLNFVTYDEDTIYCNQEPNEYTLLEVREERMKLQICEHFVEDIDFPTYKCMFVGEPKIVAEAEKALLNRYHSLYSIYRSVNFFVEIMEKNTDKATALNRLVSSIGLTKDQLICCGDGYNDLAMMEFAGLCVAMGNAVDEVKERADFVTKSNDEDGIAYVIEKFMK